MRLATVAAANEAWTLLTRYEEDVTVSAGSLKVWSRLPQIVTNTTIVHKECTICRLYSAERQTSGLWRRASDLILLRSVLGRQNSEARLVLYPRRGSPFFAVIRTEMLRVCPSASLHVE
eukprot:3140896-Rhodomonas_salina.2